MRDFTLIFISFRTVYKNLENLPFWLQTPHFVWHPFSVAYIQVKDLFLFLVFFYIGYPHLFCKTNKTAIEFILQLNVGFVKKQ